MTKTRRLPLALAVVAALVGGVAAAAPTPSPPVIFLKPLCGSPSPGRVPVEVTGQNFPAFDDSVRITVDDQSPVTFPNRVNSGAFQVVIFLSGLTKPASYTVTATTFVSPPPTPVPIAIPVAAHDGAIPMATIINDTASATYSIPCPTPTPSPSPTPTSLAPPVVTLKPAVGPPGTVTLLKGSGFPAGAVDLAWSAGIFGPVPSTVLPDATGTFTLELLIYQHDTIGSRVLTATPVVPPPGLGAASAGFLVVPGSVQPGDFSWRN